MSERKLVSYVYTGGGAQMSFPIPSDEDGLEWIMRYGDPASVRYVAASVIESYDYLLSGNITTTEAIRRLRILRAERRRLSF